MHYQTGDGDRLDILCQRHYQHQSGAVEAVLRANPHLADQGTVLPAGVLLVLPALPASQSQDATIRLWS